MRRLFLEQYHKRIFPSTPITSFFPFLSYIVVTPLMIGFSKDFSCHYHLGLIRIPPLFLFPPAPFPRNEKDDGTLELYYFSTSCLPKILLLQLVGHRVFQISCVLSGFPMLLLPYQFGRSRMNRLNIFCGSLVLTLMCGILSRLAFRITSCSGWNKIQPFHLLYCPQPFIVPFLKQNGFMLLHRLVIPLRSSLFFQFRSRLVHNIEWPILLRTLDSIVLQ